MDAEQTYLEMMANASKWNGMLLRDRSERLPFYDAQTGTTQNETRHLWHKESERFPGFRADQVFSYPAPRWKWVRKARPMQSDEVNGIGNGLDVSNDFEGAISGRMAAVDGVNSNANWSQSELDNFLHGEDDFPEPEEEDEEDLYDESYKKRRRKAGVSPYGSRRGGGRRQVTDEDASKPYVCETCGLGYKTKPGLQYHLLKAHPVPAAAPAISAPSEFVRPRLPSNICDVCRNESFVSQKTGKLEEMIICSDCGKAGHPSCLQFTDNMIISAKKYKWQCIDCKTCAVCGTSENDDVLLFCDDCDRGYHMYCLTPPISEPPEGAWSCRLCLAEFNENAASQSSQQVSHRPTSASSRQITDQIQDTASRDSGSDATKQSGGDRPSSVSQDQSDTKKDASSEGESSEINS